MGSDCSCTRCGLRTSSDSATSSMRCCCPRSAPTRSHARRARGRLDKAARRGGGRRRLRRYEPARKACGRLRPLPRTAAPRRISRSCPPTSKNKQNKQLHSIAISSKAEPRAPCARATRLLKKRGATSPPHHRAPHGNSGGDQEAPPARAPRQAGSRSAGPATAGGEPQARGRSPRKSRPGRTPRLEHQLTRFASVLDHLHQIAERFVSLSLEL